MAKRFEFSILAKFKDQASRGLRRFSRRLRSGVGGGILGGLTRGLTGALGGLAGVATKVAGGIVSAFTRALKGVVGLFQKAVSTITGLLWKIGKVAGVAAAGAAAGFAVLWRQTARAGDRIAKMARRTGLAVEFLSELDHVARLNDASLEAVQMGLRGLGRAVEGAARGSKEYLDVWRQLGVPLRDNAGRLRDTEKLFWDVIDALGKVENRTLRMGLAQRMFGRSGEAMLAMVDAGTEALREQRREARRLGGAWSREYAADAERAMDSMTRMGTAWRGLRRAFLAPFLEPVAKLLENFAERLADNREKVRQWGDTAAQAFEKAAKAIGQKLRTAYNWLVTRDWSLQGLKEGFSNALVALNAFVRAAAGPAKETLVAAFEWVASQVEGIFRTLWDVVFRDFRRGFGREINKIGGALTARANRMVQAALERHARSAYEIQFGKGSWERASEEDKALRRKSATLPWKVKEITDAMSGFANILGEVGLAVHTEVLSDAEKAERAATIRAQADAKAGAASERLGTALRDLREAAQAVKPDLGGAMPAGGAQGGAGAQGAPDNAEARRLQGLIKRKRNVLDMLKAQGYAEEARKLSKEIERLDAALSTTLEKSASAHEEASKRLSSLTSRVQAVERRLSRLGTARA